MANLFKRMGGQCFWNLQRPMRGHLPRRPTNKSAWRPPNVLFVLGIQCKSSIWKPPDRLVEGVWGRMPPSENDYVCFVFFCACLCPNIFQKYCGASLLWANLVPSQSAYYNEISELTLSPCLGKVLQAKWIGSRWTIPCFPGKAVFDLSIAVGSVILV